MVNRGPNGLRMGLNVGSQGWIPRLGPNFGSKGWVQRMCPMVGSQGWVSRLGPNVVSKGVVPRFGPRVWYKSSVSRFGPMFGSQGSVPRLGATVCIKVWYQAWFWWFVPNAGLKGWVHWSGPKAGSHWWWLGPMVGYHGWVPHPFLEFSSEGKHLMVFVINRIDRYAWSQIVQFYPRVFVVLLKQSKKCRCM